MQHLIQKLIRLGQMYDRPLQQVLDFTLDCIVECTGSECGFLNWVDDDEQTISQFSWSKGVMDECSMSSNPQQFCVSDGGLWTVPMKEKRPFICNDYSAPHPDKKGLPEGHAPLRRLLILPVKGIPLIGAHPDQARVVLLSAVANKKEPYDEHDVDILTLLLEATWRHILRHNLLEKMRRDKEYLEDINEQLRASNEELTQFAYVASHDLKAPLRAVYNLASWITEDYAKGNDVSNYVKLLKPRVVRMESLINGLLEYSRIGRTDWEAKMLHTQDLVQEVIEDIDNGFGRVRIVGTLPDVPYNEMRLRQVFTNLISNALKHHHDPDNAHVVVRAVDGCLNPVCPACPRRHSSRDMVWSFCVSDDGPGIDPKYHKKIFEMFQTLKPKDESDSTGIGLSLVKRIVEEHGGSVWVDSSPGGGSEFFFSVPKVEEPDFRFP